jgi:hypothetical protein
MFNKYGKKVMSLAMASAMIASMAVPAFAEGETESTASNNTIKIDGAYQAVTINVDVPTTGEVVINPYALPVSIGKNADDKDVKVSAQIVTKPLTIKNKTDVALDINVSATATVAGALTLATSPIADVTTDTKNDAFIYLAIETTTLSGEPTADALGEGAINAAYGKQTWTAYAAENTPANVLALKAGTTAVTKSGMGTLAAATMDDDGAFKEYNEGSVAFVGLSGQCAQTPKTAWTAADGLTANIAFTFTPHVEKAEA